MSLIFEGNDCPRCGRKRWYYNFGYPYWYQKMVFQDQRASPPWRRFQKMQNSKLCPWCFVKKTEPIAAAVMIERYLRYGNFTSRVIKRRDIRNVK